MLDLPPRAVDAAIGVFLLLMIPVRRWLAANLVSLRLPHLAAAGAVIGFLTGIVAATGPADVPFFIGYGLTKGAFIGTEAAASLAVYATKTLTFRWSGARLKEWMASEPSMSARSTTGSCRCGC